MFDFPGAEATVLREINNAGQILLNAYGETWGGHFFYDRALPPINVPGAHFGAPESMNDSGQVVGWYYYDSSQHGFIYEGGIYQTFDIPYAKHTKAIRIYNYGRIDVRIETHDRVSWHDILTPCPYDYIKWY